jgi:hypothetical protein
MRVEIRPSFDESVIKSEHNIRKAAAKMLMTLQELDLTGLWNHHGLNFEKLHGMIEPVSGRQLYSLRVTQGVRAVACLENGPLIILVSLHTQHDKTYRKQ